MSVGEMRRSQEKLRKLSGHGACLTLNEREGRKKAWWKHLRPQHSPKKKVQQGQWGVIKPKSTETHQ